MLNMAPPESIPHQMTAIAGAAGGRGEECRGMSGRVAGRSVIITGAGSGMGRAFALALAREGATVGVPDLDEAATAAVRAEIGAGSGAAG
jgi:hypothetical protein